MRKSSKRHRYTPFFAILSIAIVFMMGLNRFFFFDDEVGLNKMIREVKEGSLNAKPPKMTALPAPPPCIRCDTYEASPVAKEFELAYHQSFGFFDNIHENDWKRMQQRVQQRINYKRMMDDWDWMFAGRKFFLAHRNDDLSDPMILADKPRLWFQNNLEPDFTCLHELRIGGLGDGPKWVCDPHRLVRISNERKKQGAKPGCLVYSIGSAGRFHFEDALHRFLGNDVCEIHIFDPEDYTRPGDKARGIYFHAWGIQGSQEPRRRKMKSIPETIRELGHEDRTIDLFKIDCEGCEWSSYRDWLQYDIRQIQVETHFVPKHALDFFESHQAAGYLTYHKEFNLVGYGRSVEWGFIRVHPEFFAVSA